MKKPLFILALLLALLNSCKEHIDEASRYVFTEQTIASYLEKHADTYSQYLEMLSQVKASTITETSVYQLMTARGNYTVFAPTNDAIDRYIKALNEKGDIVGSTWGAIADSTKRDSLRNVIVYNSIIVGGDEVLGNYYMTSDFPKDKAEFPAHNMYDRRLVVTYNPKEYEQIYINDAPVNLRNRDIPAINGVIHAMDSVIAPSNNTMWHLMSKILENKEEGYYVASMLAQACGMKDTLLAWRDETYELKMNQGLIPDLDVANGNGGSNYVGYAPEHRYFGFTYFAETDSFWRAETGIEPTELTPHDVMNYLQDKGLYPDALVNDNYTDTKNLLNQFVTYHFLPERLSTDHLVYHYNEMDYDITRKILGVAMSEYYTTMGKRRLLKIYESRESKGIFLNRFPNLDNGRQGNYHELSCDPDKEGIRIGEPNLEGEYNTRNGIIYPIDQLLAYDQATINNMQRHRIRWDVASMFPELVNNDIRMSPLTDTRHARVAIPCDVDYKYFDDATIEEGTAFFYWTGRNMGWHNYLGDEFNLQGMSDVTLRLPPVPASSTYELRFAVQSGGCRGMVQFYWGSDPAHLAVQGIPLDIRLCPGSDPKAMGYENDTEDDDYNLEIDKRMRNHGFMKGAAQYGAGNPGTTVSGRADKISSRRIIVRQWMDPDKTYYIRFKTVLDEPTKQFYMDYLEYCPKDVYDNPETPEDIW